MMLRYLKIHNILCFILCDTLLFFVVVVVVKFLSPPYPFGAPAVYKVCMLVSDHHSCLYQSAFGTNYADR